MPIQINAARVNLYCLPIILGAALWTLKY